MIVDWEPASLFGSYDGSVTTAQARLPQPTNNRLMTISRDMSKTTLDGFNLLFLLRLER